MDVNYRAAEAAKRALVLDHIIWSSKPSAGVNRHEYLTDEPLFSQGDPANAVFYIHSGKVRLTVKSVDGEQAVISTLPEGSFLGECCLAGQADRSTTACALLRSTVVRIEKQAMMDLLRTDPEFSERFLNHTLSRYIRLEADLVSHLFESDEERPAQLRMVKANFSSERKPIPVTANMSPESLAEMIGISSSQVSFFLERFRALGVIDFKGDEMLVHSSLMNIVLHHDGKYEDAIHRQ